MEKIVERFAVISDADKKRYMAEQVEIQEATIMLDGSETYHVKERFFRLEDGRSLSISDITSGAFSIVDNGEIVRRFRES